MRLRKGEEEEEREEEEKRRFVGGDVAVERCRCCDDEKAVLSYEKQR